MATSPGVGLVLKFIDRNDIKLGKVLGRGGFGTVYRATHVNWGRVAVKRLLNIKVTESLQKEAEKMVRSLTSPYLVRIMGLIETPSGVDIVMEFFEHGSLKEFEEKYMKCECWARKVKMIQDIAYGMNFLHTSEPPIAHCDLKLENVFVAAGFRAKIGDFGLAVSSTKSRLNAGESGTVSHMPPEAFETAQVVPDEAWDIFTFGITTYELTSGCDPWPQMRTFANEKLVAIWVGKGERPNLEAIPSDAPTELVNIITSCWVAKPSERPRFINILDNVTELFETNYEHNLRKADRAISEQMDLVQESSERKASSTDSGWGSLEVRSNNEQQQDTVTLAQSTSSSRDEEASTADIADGAESDHGNMDSMSFKEHQQTATTDESACAARDEGSSVTGTVTETSGTEAGLERQELEVAESSRTDRDEESQAVETDKGMQWQYKHKIDTPGYIYSCRWINPRHLAVCMKGCVKVYEVTTTSSHLAYTITSKRWKPLFGQPKEVRCTAVSEALPGRIMVICEDQPFVYQFPCQEATKETTRHRMKGDGENPNCIVANATVAIISMHGKSVLLVFNLPDFTQRSKLSIDGSGMYIKDLSINSEHLLVMFDHKIVIKRSLAGGILQNVCEIQPPERKSKARQEFCSVCCVDTDSRELYAAYEEDDVRRGVYKYILSEGVDGKETECMNTGRVIGDEWECIHDKGLSLTSDGMMASGLHLSEGVNLYILE